MSAPRDSRHADTQRRFASLNSVESADASAKGFDNEVNGMVAVRLLGRIPS